MINYWKEVDAIAHELVTISLVSEIKDREYILKEARKESESSVYTCLTILKDWKWKALEGKPFLPEDKQ